MKKKKIILAVLASLCVTAGAVGIAACTTSGTTHDPALYAIYQEYAQSTENPLDYEDWLADVLAKFEQGGQKGPNGNNGKDGEKGVTIEDVKLRTIDGKKYYEFIFSDGKIVRLAADGSGRQETTSFTMYAVDQNREPVENVYFSIGYEDGSTTYYMTADGSFVDNSEFNKVYAARTNANGVATFYTFPEGEHDYRIYIADPNSIDGEGRKSSVPNGYNVKFGKDPLWGWDLNSAPFVKDADGNYSVTVSVVMDNSWRSRYKASNDLKYKRYSDGTVEYTPYVKNAVKSQYNYFTLEPYASSIWEESAGKAASGVYRVSWSANNPAANVQLMAYSFFNGDYFFQNDDGSPADALVTMYSGNIPTDETLLRQRYKEDGTSQSYESWLNRYKNKFSGTNYVDVTIEFDTSFLAYCFAFIADTNCEVTISVERIGNVAEWTDRQENANAPAGTKKESDHQGRILDVPLNSVIVRDNNGVYHVGDINGPILYVQLLNGTRANSMSMLALTSYTVGDGEDSSTRSAFSNYVTEEFDPATNSGVRIHTDYTPAVKTYASCANSAGLYPVNDQIKTILETFCTGFIGWNNYDHYWVAACAYYGPESDGSQDAPYDLSVGNNTINLNGTTYVSFRTQTTGYYGFSSTNAEFSFENAIEVDGTHYVQISAHQEYVFTVTGSGSVATINIVTLNATKLIEYSFDGTNDVGTASNPVHIQGSGIYQVNINHDMSVNKKIAVNFEVAYRADGEFLIEIYGSATAQVLDENFESLNGKTITVAYPNSARLWIDDVNDGTFFIKITKLS